MTFTKDKILRKLEDLSRQMRRLSRLGQNYEVVQSTGEPGPIESRGSPEEARAFSERSEDLSSKVIIWAEARRRQDKMAMTSRKTEIADDNCLSAN